MTSSDARFPYSSSSLHPPRALAYLSLAAQFGSLAAVGALAFEPLAQACDAIAPSLDLLTLVGWLGGAAATLRLAELLWAPGGTPLLLQRFESARVEAAFLDYHFESYYKVTQAFTGTMVGQVGLTYLFLRRNARGRGDELVVQQCALTVIGYAALFALRHWLRTWPDASRARTAFVTTWIGFYVVCVLHASRSAWGNGELRESLQVGALLLGALFTLLLTAYNHVALPLEPPQRVASVGLALVQATFPQLSSLSRGAQAALLLAAALGGDVVGCLAERAHRRAYASKAASAAAAAAAPPPRAATAGVAAAAAAAIAADADATTADGYASAERARDGGSRGPSTARSSRERSPARSSRERSPRHLHTAAAAPPLLRPVEYTAVLHSEPRTSEQSSNKARESPPPGAADGAATDNGAAAVTEAALAEAAAEAVAAEAGALAAAAAAAAKAAAEQRGRIDAVYSAVGAGICAYELVRSAARPRRLPVRAAALTPIPPFPSRCARPNFGR